MARSLNIINSGNWPKRFEKVDTFYYGLANVWLGEGRPADALQLISCSAHHKFGKNLLKTVCVEELLGRLKTILEPAEYDSNWEEGGRQPIDHFHKLIDRLIV